MLAYLSLFESGIPEPIERSLKVAKRFRLEMADATALLDARAECWIFNDDGATSTAEKAIARAAICVLYPSPEAGADAIDVIGFFLSCANVFEDHSNKIVSLFLKYFRKFK